MIDKATFEAHVRAEAERRWPMPDDEPDHTSMDRQSTYIAARMEHEWPVVEALQKLRRVFKVINKEWTRTGGVDEGVIKDARAAIALSSARSAGYSNT